MVFYLKPSPLSRWGARADHPESKRDRLSPAPWSYYRRWRRCVPRQIFQGARCFCHSGASL